jgi:hypothetical protein
MDEMDRIDGRRESQISDLKFEKEEKSHGRAVPVQAKVALLLRRVEPRRYLLLIASWREKDLPVK